MALKAEKRLNAAKLSVKDARFDSERTVLEGWMRKDELLVKRLRAGRAGKNGRVGLDGWKKRVASYDGAINLYRSRINGHQNFLHSLKSQYESSFETQQSQRRSTEAPQQSRAERPETQTESSSESRSEQRSERPSETARERAQTSSGSESQSPGRERESAKETPSEQEAKRFAGEWNSRYGSQFKVNANELERLIPDDRVPNAYEMGSILEQYLILRPWGLWKVPGLKGLFSFVIKNRIRSLRDAM